MRIERVEVHPVAIPLARPYRDSTRIETHSRDVLVRLVTNEGAEGWGAGAPRAFPTGETQHGLVAVLERVLAGVVIGNDPFAIEAIHGQMARAVAGNYAAKAAVDIALHDLVGRLLGRPVHDLLGGRLRDSMPALDILPLDTPERMAETPHLLTIVIPALNEEEAIGSTLLAIASGARGASATAALSDLLVARLPSAGEEERVQIARVLARLEAPEARVSMDLLLADPSPAVRRTAVEALAREPAPAGAPESLRIALADESALVRIAAAGVLARSDAPAVLDDLACLARDEDARVRAAAVRAVAARAADLAGGPARERCLALVGAALEDEGVVALAAVEGLSGLGGGESARRTLVALERGDAEILRAALRCIGSHGDAECLERILPLVSHREWSVRAEATQVLAERGVARAIPPILRRLETEQDDFVRSVILRALARLEG